MREKLIYLFVHQTLDNPTDPTNPCVETQLLDYDARGNLTHIEREINNPELPMDTSRESVQKLVWDEEDRLLGVDLRPESDRGQPHIAAYTYDAGGERGIRYVSRQQEGVSSGTTAGYAQDMDIILYPNALITVRPQELPEDFDPMRMHPSFTFTTYTKHYYIGSERINSKLGTIKDLGILCEQVGGYDLLDEMNTRVLDAGKRLEELHTDLDKDLRLNSPYLYSREHQFVCDFKSHNPELYDAYWYHPDHLGSSSYITNTTGEISQHFEYLPFGETLVEEHLNSYNSPFKFNGKEYDAETGNYYYGARYMNPKWVLMLAVDQMYEKHPSFSPYVYTLQNPVKYTDPTGMTAEKSDWIPKINEDGSTTYIAEEGDDKFTLASQYGLAEDIANNLYSTIENGEISGGNVMAITGSVIMKLDLNSPEGKSSQRRFDQFLFARDHTSSEDGWAFLSTDYYSNTKYKDEISGWAKMNVGDETFSVNYAIPLYRSATFDKSSSATALGISPLRPKPVGRTSLFSNQDNMRFPRYHPDTRSRNGDYDIYIHSSNSRKAMNRLKWEPPRYKYLNTNTFKN